MALICRLSNCTSKPSCQFKVQISDMELVQIKKLLQFLSKNVVKAGVQIFLKTP